MFHIREMLMYLRHPFARPEAASHRGTRAVSNRGGEEGAVSAKPSCGAVLSLSRPVPLSRCCTEPHEFYLDSLFPKSRKPRWRRATHTAPILSGRNPAPPYRRDSPAASSQYSINQLILALDEPIWGRVNSWTTPGARRFPGPIGVPSLPRTGTPGLTHTSASSHAG